MEINFGYKVWLTITRDGKEIPILGEKKYYLLKTIQETGSINSAAKKLNLDFRKAWDMIHSINHKVEPETVVITARGGKGGTYLSSFGENLLKAYEKVNDVFKHTKNQITLNNF